jgi:hypothetical protein
MTTLMLVVSLFVWQQPEFAEFGTLSGQVRDINGGPAAALRVEAIPIPVVSYPGSSRNPPQPASATESDSEGRYRLEGLRPGSYLIAAHSAGAPTYYPGFISKGREQAVTVRAGQEVTGLDFPTAFGVPLAGTETQFAGVVRVDDGSPLPRLSFSPWRSAIQVHRSCDSIGSMTTALADGSFGMGSSPRGDCVLSLAPLPLGYYLTSMSPPSPDSGGIEIVLTTTPPAGSPRGATVSGRLTNLEEVYPGSPSAVVLELTEVSASGRPRYEAAVEPLGLFRILGVPPGRYSLRTRGSRPVTIDVAADDVTGIDLLLGNPAVP